MRAFPSDAPCEPHGRILGQLGVDHVVYPEHDMGRRVAHLVRGGMLDFIQFEPDFAMVTTRPPAFLVGRPLAETGVRREHGVTVVGGDDTVIVSGLPKAVETFSDLR